MKQLGYIKEWFELNKKKLNLTLVQYYYNLDSETHFIYCEPEIDKFDPGTSNLLIDLILDFEKKFEGSQIGVLDIKSLTRPENPITIYQISPEVKVFISHSFNVKLPEFDLQRLIFSEIAIPYSNPIAEKQINFINTSIHTYKLRNIESEIIISPSIFFNISEPEIAVEKTNEIVDVLILSNAA